MRLSADERSVAIFEALASETRLKIVGLLADHPMNLGDLARALAISPSAITAHIRKLEDAGVTGSIAVAGKHGSQKICSLIMDEISLSFIPSGSRPDSYSTEVPVGHYVDWSIRPTCGLAGANGFIGHLDDPRFFADPARVDANMIWLGGGFVEYRLPNYLLPSQDPVALEFIAELSSEAWCYDNEWPSDICFHVNGIHVGTWTSPGDFGGRRGAYSPAWLPDVFNQYGLLKVLRIDNRGTTIDGVPISNVSLSDLGMQNRADITIRLESPETATHPGGLTIFGRGFGNYGRNPEMKLYCSNKSAGPSEPAKAAFWEEG